MYIPMQIHIYTDIHTYISVQMKRETGIRFIHVLRLFVKTTPRLTVGNCSRLGRYFLASKFACTKKETVTPRPKKKLTHA